MQALHNGYTSNPLLVQVLEELTTLASLGFHILFRWIPGHIGIKGNEKNDRAAKGALNLEVEDLSLPYSDFCTYICKYIRSQWQLFWDTQIGNKLHEFHPKIGLWKSSLQLSRKDQVLLTRCLIHVHSRLTHSFLLNNEPVPECVFCACPLTIRHVLLECGDPILLRQHYFNAVSMCDIFLNVDGQTILAFLKGSGKARLL